MTGAVSRRDMRIPLLTSIGLSADADLVYRHLVAFGPHKVGDLCHALGIPPNRMRSALDELSDINAVHSVRGQNQTKTRLWRCASPQAVANEVRIRQRQAALDRHRLNRRLATLAEIGISVAASSGRVIGDLMRVQARVNELIAAERCEHLVMDPIPAYDDAAVSAAADANKALLENKIAVRDLGVPPVISDRTGELTERFASNGAQIRQLPSVPAKFMVFDRSAAIVRLDPNDPGQGFLEVNDTATVNTLVQLFLRHWERASVYQTRATHVELTQRERAIVRLLAAGVNDNEVANRLGLSVRTIAYTMRDLMDKYGAKNRFQLGLALGPIIGPPTSSPAEAQPIQRER